MDWPVVPESFTDLLLDLTERYPNLPPIYITENGSAEHDVVSLTDRHDTDHRLSQRPPACPGRGDPRRGGRARLLRLVAARQLRVGVRIRRRFGIVRVTTTPERLPKDSYFWYQRLNTTALATAADPSSAGCLGQRPHSRPGLATSALP